MKFILIFGPQAVGKMTVGHELEKITDLTLFHNHMTIDFALKFFPDHGTGRKRLSNALREVIFQEVAHSDSLGIIFTFVWAFDLQEDWEYVKNMCAIFEKYHAEIIFVELEATFETRLERNTSEFRLAEKSSKRDISTSEKDLRHCHKTYRLTSLPGEITHEKYIRINNEFLTPAEVAEVIKQHFSL